MIIKPLILSLIVFTQPRATAASPDSLIERLHVARENEQKLMMVLHDPLPVKLTRSISISSTPYSSTTFPVPFKMGALTDASAIEGDSEMICTLNVWRGLMTMNPIKKVGTFDFNLQGRWQIFSAAEKKSSNRATSSRFERVEFELALWPVTGQSSLVEKGIYSMDVTVKVPLPKTETIELTVETLKSCFGSGAQVFSYTPSK